MRPVDLEVVDADTFPCGNDTFPWVNESYEIAGNWFRFEKEPKTGCGK